MARKGSSLRAVGALAAIIAILGGLAAGLGFMADIAVREATPHDQTEVSKFLVQVGQVVKPRLLLIGGLIACGVGVVGFALVRMVDWIRG